MDSTNLEQAVQLRISQLLPSINRLTPREIKHHILASRKQQTQRENLRNAWRCGQSQDVTLSDEQEFLLHCGLAAIADLNAEGLRKILIGEIEASLRKELEVQSWMLFGGEIP